MNIIYSENSDIKNIKKSKRQKIITISFALLAVLALSSVGTVGGMATAQSSPTVTATCEEDDDGQLNFRFLINDLDPNAFYYFEEVFPDRYDVFGPVQGFAPQYSITGNVLTEGEYTLNVYEDVDRDFDNAADNVEAEEFVATGTVTCQHEPEEPPLNEQFKNQGQCIKFAREFPNSGITKLACQEAFEDEV